MRTATAATTIITAVALVLALLLLPGTALAVEGAPDEMVDPVAAMEPEIVVAEPADDAVVAEAAATPEVQGIEPPADAPTGAVAGAVASPTWTAPTTTGSLPFTGPAPGLLMLLFLVGSLALCAGAVAYGYARASAEPA